jgi:hypothetical protein
VSCLAVGTTGCKKEEESTNADFAESFDQHHYDDIVTTEEYHEYEDQGQGISPRELEYIQDTIESYKGDFEHCLEVEMDRLENRWVGGEFAVEFHIETDGKVSMAKMLESKVQEARTLKDDQYVPLEQGGAPPRSADNFAPCVEKKLLDWEFEPPPEAQYVHTYTGHIGEAW